jgi:hypothetical protein
MVLQRTFRGILELAAFLQRLGWRPQLWLVPLLGLVSMLPVGLLFRRFRPLLLQLTSGVLLISRRLVCGTQPICEL